MADHPLTFPSHLTVPILGQRVTLKAWFPTAVITCTCTATPDPIVLISGMPAPCPACGTHYLIAKIHHEHNNPQAQVIQVAVVTVQQPSGSPS